MDPLAERRAELLPVGKGEVEVVRPAGMTGDEQRTQTALPQLPLQRRQRPYRQLVVLRQRGDEAVPAVRAEPEGVAGKKIPAVDEIHHVTPCVAGNEEALDPDAVDVEDLPIAQQHLFVADRHLGQLVQVVDDPAAHLPGEIAVLVLADVQLRVSEQAGTVGLHRTHMVGVLMGDEDMPDGLRIDAQPAHLLRQPVVVIARVDHDGGIALAIEKDVGHPLPHTGHVFVDPAGVQGLEDLLAPVHPAHFLFLKFGCPSGHAHPPLSYVIARLA